MTGASAAALHGFALYGHDLSDVHLLRMDAVRSHHAAATNHHAVTLPVTERDIEIVDGIRVVCAARAVWEVACRSSLEGGVVTADSALHQDPTLADRIEEMTDRFAYFPGSRQGRAALRLADHRSESPGESVSSSAVPSLPDPDS